MTIQLEAYLKDKFAQTRIPQGTDFSDLIESTLNAQNRGVIPLNRFGLSMSEYTAADADQLTVFQAAIDSAAGSGDIILLPGGKLVLDGTLHIPTLGGIVGADHYRTHLKLADAANVRMIAINDPLPTSTGNATGGLYNILARLHINGNRNNNTFTGSCVYSYTGATGLTGQTDMQTILGLPRTTVDPQRLFRDLQIIDASGIGFETAGRGENRYENIMVLYPVGNGFKFATYDEFAINLTVGAPGGVGFEFATGAAEFRLTNGKAFFCGMDETRSDGDGYYVSAGGSNGLMLVNCSAQDTHRHGFNMQGYTHSIQGQADACGSLFAKFGFGNPTVDTQRSVFRSPGMKDSRVSLNVTDRHYAIDGGSPHAQFLVDLRSETDGNVFDFQLSEQHGATGSHVPGGIRTTNIGAGRLNHVRINGREVYGWTWTTANIELATHAVNTKGKFQGRRIFNTTTNKPLWATGSTATSTWVDATGATAHTPV